MTKPARFSLLLLLVVACAVPYSDSVSPPRPEVCAISRTWKPRPTACARLVGTVVDPAGHAVPNATVFYALKDRARDPGGYLLVTEADAQGNFQVTLYRTAGLATYPDTATVRVGASTVSPRRAVEEGVPASPRWMGTVETVVTYVRVGGTLTAGTARVVLDYYVP